MIVITLEGIFNEIMKILGTENEGSYARLNVAGDEIWFEIYDSKIPLVVDAKKKYVYLSCEGLNARMTADMMLELALIMRLVNDNLDTILKIF